MIMINGVLQLDRWKSHQKVTVVRYSHATVFSIDDNAGDSWLVIGVSVIGLSFWLAQVAI